MGGASLLGGCGNMRSERGGRPVLDAGEAMPRSRRWATLVGGCCVVALAGACGAATPSTATTGHSTTWKSRTLPKTVEGLDAVSCPTGGDCWAVGSTSTGGGAIVGSTDGGSTWTSEASPGATTASPNSTKVIAFGGVSCPTSTDCWVVGATTANTGAVIATADGGHTWRAQNVPTSDDGRSLYGLKSVSCPTSSNCWAVGATTGNTGAVLSSADGGRTWSTQSLPGGIGVLNGVSCATSTACFVVGATASNTGVVLATTDGGSSWSSQTLPSGISQTLPSGLYALNGVSCSTAMDCRAVGASTSDAGVIVATTDGGRTWTSQPLPRGIALLNGVSCSTTSDCRAVGATASKREAVLVTLDSGRSWTSQSVPPGTGLLYGVSCPTTSTCRAVGSTSSNAGAVLTSDR